MPAWKAALALSLSPVLASAIAPAAKKCGPPQTVAPKPGLAPNSTYYNNGEPPERFLVMPKGFVKTRYGRDAIDELCGVPPCGMIFLGCVRGDVMVLPDPRSPDFAKITRHELAHVNGWPATHGD